MEKSPLLKQMDVCIQLCDALYEVLVKERKHLIAFKTEELLSNNLEKEQLLSLLVKNRAELKEYVKVQFGVSQGEEIENGLPEPLRAEWQQKREQWHTTWERMNRQLKTNQQFIDNSQHYLSVLSDNFKQLFQERPLYSPKGKPCEWTQEGKVIEGSI